MNANYSYPSTPPVAPPKRRTNLLTLVVIGLVLVFCCCLAAAAIIVFADPFNLHITDRLFGGAFDAAAEAMPEDTSFYVGVNLLGATPDQLDRVIRPFAEALETDQKTWDDVIREIDKAIGEELDVTLTGDVKPWIGQYLGIGIFDIKFDNPDNPARLIVAIESRDNSAADRFLLRLRDSIEKINQENLNESEYQGVKIYTLQPEYGTGLAFCRSGNLVLFSLEKSDIQTAIDSQKGKALIDNSNYRDMINKMPNKRLATVYFTSQEFENLLNELQGQTGMVFGLITEGLGGSTTGSEPDITRISLNDWDSMIFSLSVTGAGLQIDSATEYNLDNLSASQREMLQSMGKASKTLEMLPEDTLVFLTSQRLDLAYDTYLGTIRDLSPDASGSIDNTLQSVRDAMGIDLENDLIYRLDGEFALGIFPSSDGILAQQSNIDLGFALLAESSDTDVLANTMEIVASKLEDEGAGVERFDAGNLSLYEFLQQSNGDIVFASGIEKDYMSIASSSQAIVDLFAGDTPLSRSPRYREAISPLPDGITPVLYLDVEGIIGTIRESLSGSSRSNFDQGIKVLEPIPYVVMGYSELNCSVMRMSLIIHVK
jgi:hypothetical protein